MAGDAKSAAPRPDSVELRVARLVKAHGLKGGVKLELYTDDPELRFQPGASFRVQVPEDSPWFGKTISLVSIREINSHPVAFFEGVEERSVAETLVKAILWVEHDPTSQPTEKDAWFDHQLVGLRVLRDGVEVGRVVRVEHFPAQDLLVIKRGDEEVLLPFVAAFVPSVDIDQGVITITPPGGLLEPLEDEPTP
jgi:16S rRNA processing protein RimM